MPFHFPASPDLIDLHDFVQVVEHGGFSAEARALNQPKSKFSRRITMPEERLRVRLIQRSTRRFAVTEPGQSYDQRCVASRCGNESYPWQEAQACNGASCLNQ